MKTILFGIGFLTLVATLGCGKSDDGDAKKSAAEPTGKQYLVETQPQISMPVGDARAATKDGDSVNLLGRIGGSTSPFIEGLAAFTIVDPKVHWCPPEEGCPTPWDYCCKQSEVKENIATVKVLNEAGAPVAEDARKLLGVKELSLVIVEGTAQRDDQGNLSVMAKKVFIKEL